MFLWPTVYILYYINYARLRCWQVLARDWRWKVECCSVIAFHAVYSSSCLRAAYVDGKSVHLCVWLFKCGMYRWLHPEKCAVNSWATGLGKYSLYLVLLLMLIYVV